MASSGWQNEQLWFTYSGNVRLIGNIEINSIDHTGTSLRIQGRIAGGARGNSGYYFTYYDYTSYAQPEGGNKLALGGKGKTWKVGTSDETVYFDVTLSNVPAAATSRSFYVNFYGPNTNSVVATLSWTLQFDASGDPPTGGYITYNSCTDSSVNATTGVTGWGGLTGDLQAIVVTGATNGAAANATSANWQTMGRRVLRWENVDASTLSATGDISDASTTASYDSPINIKGLLAYKLAYFNSNAGGVESGLDDTLRFLPPSIGKITYTDPGGEGSKTYPVVFTGDPVPNYETYDTSYLKRTVRYKVDDGDWTYAANNTQALIGANTSFNVTVPAGKSAVIEAWQSYHGVDSAVKTVTLYNGNVPSRAYYPVNGLSKRMNKLYWPVNGSSKELVKVYYGVNGQAKSILG